MDDTQNEQIEPAPASRGQNRLSTRSLSRNLALTRLGLNIGGHFFAHSVRNALRRADGREGADRAFYREQGRAVAAQLGRLKGGAMKAGQLLALYGDYFLPEDAVRELDRLESFSEPVAWPAMRGVLARQLGARLSELDIDEQPIGAASLGQVYRARLRASGRQLCLKIQYPGVADAVESDITTLARIFSVSRLAPSGLDLQPIFGEIREMLRREVDFRREQRYTEAFRRLLADDPRFVVPEVLARYSTRRVLAMSYEDGLDVRDARVQALPQARRDRLGHALVQLFLRELFDWRMVQTDPNFGNYRFRLDRGGADQIVLLDFGATRRFSRGFARAYADVVRGGAGRDVDMIVRGAASLGILDASFPRPVLEGFARMCMVIAEPFSDPADGHIPARLLNAEGGYRWAESDLPNRAGRAMVASSMTVHYRLPPREIVFLHRRLSGIFMMLSALRAEFSARNDVHAAVQRFERAGAAQPG